MELFSIFFILLFYCNYLNVVCFNLDVNFPIVYVDPIINLKNLIPSYFGYSVILHSEPSLGDSWIQIGAPRTNSTVKLHQQGTVYRCKIFGPCNSINVHPYVTNEYYFKDKKDGAWIGGTMDIDEPSGRVVVCGHRLINNRIVDYWMNGACYWSHANDTVSEKLVPLIDNDRGLKEIESTGGKKRYLFYYAQGQAGFSAHFSASKDGPELVLGAPGVYNWDGTTLIYRDGASTPVASKYTSARFKRQNDYAATSFGEFSHLSIANAILTTQTASFGLFGYSVTSGYFFNKNELLYVSGAPRSRTCIGQILLFKFSPQIDSPLDVKEVRQGYQLGEYFGAAVTAGDINEDGYDDLIVGAPFYTNQKYSEGRIFIFLGSSRGTLQIPQQNQIIEGSVIGGQFGSSLAFLGDFHKDGYADVAVAAPYEDDGSGVVYIYRGNILGLDSKYSQKINGKSFVPNIKGFGISISRPSDVDGNSYKDLAVGAHISGHAVLLRSRPVVTLKQTLIALTPHLDYNAKSFAINVCFWYEGTELPSPINITREIIVDELFHRARLISGLSKVQNLTLYDNVPFCQNVTIVLESHITNRYNPLTVSVTQQLINQETPSEVIYVNKNTPNQQDKFCKHCPVLNAYKSFTEKSVELSFALGCGDDNVCQSRLSLRSEFLNVGVTDQYVLGSTGYLKLETTIGNTGEKAYLTQLEVKLPKSVYFRSVPTNCLEGNSSSEVICNVESPLDENKQKSVVLDLDMKEVNTEKHGDKLNFTLAVSTSSENLNRNNVLTKTLNIVREADLALTGKTSQQSYSFEDIKLDRPNFTQIYQVEKFGASPIEEVLLTIKIPTHIYGHNLINFAKLYPPEGYHAGQPIKCYSNTKYLIDEDYDILNQFSAKIGEESNTDDVSINNKEMSKDTTPLKRSVRSKREMNDNQSNNTNEFDYPLNRTYYINCSNEDIMCAQLNCTIGPFKTKQNMAILQLKMLLDVSKLSELLGAKDIIILQTDGIVSVNSPLNFTQSGERSDNTRVSSVFIAEKPEVGVETWHIILGIVVGLLVLLLIIMGLTKAGFFQRKKKQELQALKEAEEVEQFKRDSANYEAREEDEHDGNSLDKRNSLYDASARD